MGYFQLHSIPWSVWSNIYHPNSDLGITGTSGAGATYSNPLRNFSHSLGQWSPWRMPTLPSPISWPGWPPLAHSWKWLKLALGRPFRSWITCSKSLHSKMGRGICALSLILLHTRNSTRHYQLPCWSRWRPGSRMEILMLSSSSGRRGTRHS